MNYEKEIDQIYKVFDILNLSTEENIRVFKETKEVIDIINKRLTSLEIDVQSLLGDDEA